MNAQEFLASVAASLGVPAVDSQQQLLDLTREIAHGVERWCGPLTLFLMGQAVAAGADLAEVSQKVRSLLPPPAG